MKKWLVACLAGLMSLTAHAAIQPGTDYTPLAAPQAVAATKKLLATIGGQSLDASLNQGAQAFASALRSAEAGAGLKAFSSKQPAPWTCIAGGAS